MNTDIMCCSAILLSLALHKYKGDKEDRIEWLVSRTRNTYEKGVGSILKKT